ELLASSPRIRTASRIGRPACTKAPSWRERCMISSRFTRAGVISIFRRLFFSGVRTSVMVISAPNHIDRAQYLGQGGDTGLNQPCGLVLKRPHALGPGDLADLVVRGAFH